MILRALVILSFCYDGRHQTTSTNHNHKSIKTGNKIVNIEDKYYLNKLKFVFNFEYCGVSAKIAINFHAAVRASRAVTLTGRRIRFFFLFKDRIPSSNVQHRIIMCYQTLLRASGLQSWILRHLTFEGRFPITTVDI